MPGRWWQHEIDAGVISPDLARTIKPPCTHDDLRVWFTDDAGDHTTTYGRCITCLDTIVRTVRYSAETREGAVEDRPMTDLEYTRYRRTEPQ